MQSHKIILPGIHQSNSLTNEHWKIDRDKNAQDVLSPTGDEIIMLLHGYSESAQKIYKRLGRPLDEELHQQVKKKFSIIALNGLYPLPKHFPLEVAKDKQSDNKRQTQQVHEDLLAGFAWYFYDQRTDQFLIDYKVPVNTLVRLLKQINPTALPTSFIGYSQEGYLTPFIALAYPHTKQAMGINCSFRFELIKKIYTEVPFILNQIQGGKDEIIDRDLSNHRFNEMKSFYKMQGEYHWIDQANHWLGPSVRDSAIKIFTKIL